MNNTTDSRLLSDCSQAMRYWMLDPPPSGCQGVNIGVRFQYDQGMLQQLGNRVGRSSNGFLAISLALIALITGAYFYHGIPFGFTILILVVLPMAVFSALRSVKPEEQKLRVVMKAVAALSLAVALLLTAIHLFLHR